MIQNRADSSFLTLDLLHINTKLILTVKTNENISIINMYLSKIIFFMFNLKKLMILL